MTFADLRLCEPILRAVAAEGYSLPTPIQASTIPHVLDGRDLLASAQTGTGKTAAFALPLLQRLSDRPAPGRQARCLVLCPTRELAGQIADSFATYGRHLKVTGTVIYGGVNQNPQVSALRRGVDVIVATPGRLLDLMDQGHVDLRGIEALVLDEADRMLDMGFIHDIRKIVDRMPNRRQTLLFSATLPREIRQLSQQLLSNPATVDISPETATVDAIEQSVYFVAKKDKPELLVHVLKRAGGNRALVFTRTKHGADRVTRRLRAAGQYAEAIHGNKTQNARQRALRNFTDGRTCILVATDIAARGIDVDGISHVINFDLTHEPEVYVHRIGRTARAGASGFAVSFCDHDERGNLAAIERLIGKRLAVRTDGPAYTEAAPQPNSQTVRPARHKPSMGRPSGNGQSSGKDRSGNGRPSGKGRSPKVRGRGGNGPRKHRRSGGRNRSRARSMSST